MPRWATLGLAICGLFPALAQDAKRYYYGIEHLDRKEMIRRGTLTGRSSLTSNELILAPNTKYRYWTLEAGTDAVGYVDFTTPPAGQRFTIPEVFLRPPLSPDLDGDGLSGDAEFIVGTNPHLADTDGDGISDGAAVKLGLDNLGGLTGVIGGVDTPGEALDVCAYNDLVMVADSAFGVAIFNVFSGMKPLLIAQVPTPAPAKKVACSGNLLAVGCSNVLAVIPLTNIATATVAFSVPMGPAIVSLESQGGIAYVGLGTEVALVDLATGIVLHRLAVQQRVENVAVESDILYVLGATQLRSYRLTRGAPEALGTINVTGTASALEDGKELFVGGGRAFIGHFLGFTAIDVADPAAPKLLGFTSAPQFAIHDLAANGSGALLAITSSIGGDTLKVSHYDVSNPANVTNLVTAYDTPGTGRAVTIYNGLAYVADELAGMQVVNYLPRDTKRSAPRLTLRGNFDVAKPEVTEGEVVRLLAEAKDDVQVRNVEFYLDDTKIATDGNFPFEAGFFAPLLQTKSVIRLRARASDTGGNEAWSDELTVSIRPDTGTPSIVGFAPADQSTNGTLGVLRVGFSEAMRASGLQAENFQLFSSTKPDIALTPSQFEVVGDGRGIAVSYPPLPADTYRLVVNQAALSDLAGNVLGGATVTNSFKVVPPVITSITPANLAVIGDPLKTVRVTFSLPVSPATVTNGNIQVFAASSPNSPIVATNIQVLAQQVVFTFPTFSSDTYSLVIQASRITDAGGNAVGSADITNVFTVAGREITYVSVFDGAVRDRLNFIRLDFSDLVLPSTITTNTLSLWVTGPSAKEVLPAEFRILEDKRGVVLVYDSMPTNSYELHINAPAMLSAQGEAFGKSALTNRFVVVPKRDLTGLFPAAVVETQRQSQYSADFGYAQVPDGVVNDFNGDGTLDAVLVYGVLSAQPDEADLLPGLGNGKFGNPIRIRTGVTVFSLATDDVDLDGNQDLIFVGSDVLSPTLPQVRTIYTLLGSKQGAFDRAATTTLPSKFSFSAQHVTLADLNRDGKMDAVLTGELTQGGTRESHLTIFDGKGDGSFAFRTNILSSRLVDIAVGDLDNDSFQDILVANTQTNRVAANFGAADGTFVQAANIEIGFPGFPEKVDSVAVGDFNNDRLPDLLIGSRRGDCNRFAWLATNADSRGFALSQLPSVLVPSACTTTHFATVDFNRDGNLDAIASNGSIFIGRGDGSFEQRTFGVPGRAFPADFDKDGKLDIGIITTEGLVVMRGIGDGFVGAATALPSASAIDIQLADLNGDGRIDMIATGTGVLSLGISIWTQTVTGTFLAPKDISVAGFRPTGSKCRVGDINGDKKPDLVISGEELRPSCCFYGCWALLGTGDGAFGPAKSLFVTNSVEELSLNDMDGDGNLDIIIANRQSRQIITYFGDGTGAFGSSLAVQNDVQGYRFAIGDINRDGRPDVVSISDTAIIGASLNLGDQQFSSPIKTLVRSVPKGGGLGAIHLWDFDHDGLLDLALGGDCAFVTTLKGRGDGHFEIEHTFEVQGCVAGLAVGDFDRDGIDDLVVRSSRQRTFNILPGLGGFQFGARQLFVTPVGSINSFAPGDINGDGWVDLGVAGAEGIAIEYNKLSQSGLP